MSKVINEPKNKEPALVDYRGQLEHRALWLLLLCREAEKKGLKWEDFACDAIAENGRIDGESILQAKGRTLEGLYETVFTPLTQKVFEMEVKEHTDKTLYVNFHYCPLVKAWQKQGCSDEEIARLCDIAMCGDHNIIKVFGGVLELPQCIAKGDKICELKFRIPD